MSVNTGETEALPAPTCLDVSLHTHLDDGRVNNSLRMTRVNF